jgi:hypothetical protein
MRGAIIVAALSLAACGTSSSGQSSNPTPSANGSPTAQPTVVKPKPTPPTVTTAFCKNILSVTEANQFMKPSPAYIDVNAESGDAPVNGSCNYVYAPSKAHFQIYFETWSGPVPVPQKDISDALTQLTTQLLSGDGTVTVKTFTNVSGIGDQAAFLAMEAAQSGMTIGKIDAFYVITGKVLFICGNYFLLDQAQSAPPDATQMSGLQQCAQTVASRL